MLTDSPRRASRQLPDSIAPHKFNNSLNTLNTSAWALSFLRVGSEMARVRLLVDLLTAMCALLLLEGSFSSIWIPVAVKLLVLEERGPVVLAPAKFTAPTQL